MPVLLLTIVAAGLYGALLYLITGAVCSEHAELSPTTLPLPVALGFVALGVGLPAAGANLGSWPKPALRELSVALAVLFGALSFGALMALGMGWAAAVGEVALPPERVQLALARERWPNYMAASFAHIASYGGGALGGAALALHLVLRRWRLRSAARREPAPAGATGATGATGAAPQASSERK